MYNGLLLLNKSEGFTSHDVVAKLRGILKFRRIGHAGTLDPMAEGLLVMLLGSATRASEYASGSDKEYTADFILGVITDTQDTSGTTLKSFDVSASYADVKNAVESFKGGYEQLPPMYSAIQKDGMRLYDLAREGREVERDTRFIDIPSIELIEYDEQTHRGKMAVCCSKGAYIRTICHDLGEKLSCGAAMSALMRTRVGSFKIENALTLDEISEREKSGELDKFILNTDCVFDEFPAVTVNAQGAVRALNGAHLSKFNLTSGKIPNEEDFCRVYDENGEFLMVGKGGKLDIGPNAIFPYKIFCQR